MNSFSWPVGAIMSYGIERRCSEVKLDLRKHVMQLQTSRFVPKIKWVNRHMELLKMDIPDFEILVLREKILHISRQCNSRTRYQSCALSKKYLPLRFVLLTKTNNFMARFYVLFTPTFEDCVMLKALCLPYILILNNIYLVLKICLNCILLVIQMFTFPFETLIRKKNENDEGVDLDCTLVYNEIDNMIKRRLYYMGKHLACKYGCEQITRTTFYKKNDGVYSKSNEMCVLSSEKQLAYIDNMCTFKFRIVYCLCVLADSCLIF